MKNRPCPSCRAKGGDRTGDHLFLHKSGEFWMCTRCGYREMLDGHQDQGANINQKLTIEDVQGLRTLPYRDIDTAIMDKAGVKTATSPADKNKVTDVFYPMYNTASELVAYKQRSLPKSFFTVGTAAEQKLMFFGQIAVGGGKLLIVVEGEDDYLMAKDILAAQNKATYNVVALHSAAWAERTARDNITFLEQFDTVCFALDQDKAGREATNKMAKLLTPGKTKIARYSEKDICDLYVAGKQKEFLEAIYKAKVYAPQGIVSAAGHKEKFLAKKPRESLPLPPCFEGIDEKIRGIGKQELTVITGGTGSGKSQFGDECSGFWLPLGYKVGKMALEHDVERALFNTLSVILSTNLKKHPFEDGDKLSEAYDTAFGNKCYWLIDHNSEELEQGFGMLNKVRELIISAQCDVVIIDHLNAIMYEDEGGKDGNARDDKIMRELWNMAVRYDVAILLVVHPRKTTAGTKSVEGGAFLTLDDIKGSSGIKQIPDVIITAIRNSQAEDPEEATKTTYHVLKNRYHGVTGPAGSTIFNLDTARYTAIEEEEDEDVVEY